MSCKASTEEELGKAINNDEETIEIEGNLKDKVIKIKATGKTAWLVCLAAITIAVAALALAPATAGTSAAVAGVTGTAAATILGVPVAASCVAIAVAAGGVGALNKLRNYKIVERDGRTFLVK